MVGLGSGQFKLSHT